MLSIKKQNKIRRTTLKSQHPLDNWIGKRIPPKDRPRNLIRERGDEYVVSVSCSYEDLVTALSDYGYAGNFLSTFKCAPTLYSDIPNKPTNELTLEDLENVSWEVGSMALRVPGKTGRWMHHAYWYPAVEEEFTFHISHHKERNYFDFPKGPVEHTKRGPEYFERYDPDGHLRSALDESNIEYETLEDEKYEPN